MLSSNTLRPQITQNYKLYNIILCRKINRNDLHNYDGWCQKVCVETVIRHHILSEYFALDIIVSWNSKKLNDRVHVNCCPQYAINRVLRGRKY